MDGQIASRTIQSSKTLEASHNWTGEENKYLELGRFSQILVAGSWFGPISEQVSLTQVTIRNFTGVTK